jgi:hypothetical protein
MDMSSRVSRSRALAVIGLLALAACESMDDSFGDTFEDIVDSDGYNFSAQLRGASELAGGDPDGTGVARITFSDTSDMICVDLQVRNIGPVTAAHIHRGMSRANGGPMVTLDPPDEDRRDDCIALDEALRDDIRHNPTGFYVNVHTAEFPDGAIRGQISQLVN